MKRNTIKAVSPEGYNVVKVKNIITNETGYRIDDGVEPLFVATLRSYEDYKEEKEGNECFMDCEVFTDKNGIQYIYWRDNEINADYITKVKE